MRFGHNARVLTAVSIAAIALSSCAGGNNRPELPSTTFVASREGPGEEYVIGPLDSLQIFVWRNPELSAKVQVRPDGRITTPLISDMPAVGKTPAMLADDLKIALGEYIKDPIVSVIVENFSGTFSQQVRIVGATEKPASLPYRANMTLLDAMIAVGGLSEFAAGNRARLVRFDKNTGQQREYRLRLSALLKNGDTSANVRLEPGDVIIIPESMF
ncbi:polysaccharide export protein [Sphingomonas koreensis]|jgi:polysaccharide export outer membrane protein|uniref:Polysaccharide export protein n=1 Tax=Sphingomonas koreensis TaxID=93064 RepID=A0A1L6JCK4_9SPHN|nr:XrtA/PEP-CTERM system exopolysaccharide export protein [Sphingomonas koreensis]APR53623.1 polysaccharide export protein [Sphingomonas koreensis]MDC7809642.1 polysaccharide export protein [Sphingomonas koreensis]PJI90841.1 polysaccharide export outer membrane protein [Sphingomonas koreensis]RSU24249.1 polysaccharide export protein [Sphingomonas koreensis]RSU25951.1 polysaccharide export protein [Sphingomonas koreensis]